MTETDRGWLFVGEYGDGWRCLTPHHHAMGGYTSMVDGNHQVVLGSDYLGGTNFLVFTNDGHTFQNSVIPDPYQRCPVMNLAARQSPDGKEIWAFLHSRIPGSTRCLVMCSRDDGKT